MGGNELIKRLKTFKEKIQAHHRVQQMLLFGSRATGKARPESDVDLIIVSPDFAGKSALSRPRCLYLDWDLDEPVEFICYTPEEFGKLARRPSIVTEALRTGVEI